MNWQSFSQTATGETHRQRNLPCQDYAETVSLSNAQLLIAADGHGSRRHFRSERGSRFACEAARKQMTALLESLDENKFITREQLDTLQADILREWRRLVAADLAQFPWTEEELAEEQALLTPAQYARLTEGQCDLIPYGSTLVAALVTEQGWAGIQIGDGMLVVIDCEGGYHWPMPESQVNEGNKTASLCMETPEVRICMGSMPLAGLVVCTDGLEKAFPAQGEKIIRALYLLWGTAREMPENAQQRLASAAEQIATLSIVKDDVGFAVLADCDAKDVVPKPTEVQQRRQIEHLQGKWDELVSIVAFNQRQLASTQDPDDIAYLQESIAQCRKDMLTLMEICPDKTKFHLPPFMMEYAPVSSSGSQDEPSGENSENRPGKSFPHLHGFATLRNLITRGFSGRNNRSEPEKTTEPLKPVEHHLETIENGVEVSAWISRLAPRPEKEKQQNQSGPAESDEEAAVEPSRIDSDEHILRRDKDN